MLKLYAYELKPIDSIIERLDQFKVNFYDITFPPEDYSAFDNEEEKEYL